MATWEVLISWPFLWCILGRWLTHQGSVPVSMYPFSHLLTCAQFYWANFIDGFQGFPRWIQPQYVAVSSWRSSLVVAGGHGSPSIPFYHNGPSPTIVVSDCYTWLSKNNYKPKCGTWYQYWSHFPCIKLGTLSIIQVGDQGQVFLTNLWYPENWKF